MGTRGHEALLAALPGNQEDIMRRTGFVRSRVSRLLQELRDTKEAHVSDWITEVRQGRFQAIYSAGPGEDAPKPPGKWQPADKKRGPKYGEIKRDWAIAALFGKSSA